MRNRSGKTCIAAVAGINHDAFFVIICADPIRIGQAVGAPLLWHKKQENHVLQFLLLTEGVIVRLLLHSDRPFKISYFRGNCLFHRAGERIFPAAV